MAVTKKVRFVIHHLSSGKLFISKGEEWSDKAQEVMENLLEKIAMANPNEGGYFEIRDESDSSFIIPKLIFDQCLSKVEVYEQDSERY